MGAVIEVPPDALPQALEAGDKQLRAAIARGAVAGAARGRGLMAKRSPSDLGTLRAGWRVKMGAAEFRGAKTLASLVNDAPHLPMVELGTRPHPVGPAAWAAIYEWVRRHHRGGRLGGEGRTRPRRRKAGPGPGAFQGDDPVLTKITNAIAWRIRRHGSKPTFFVKSSLDELARIMGGEMERAIAAVAKGRR